MFATHPSIADRVEALRRYAGGTVAIEDDAAPEASPDALPDAAPAAEIPVAAPPRVATGGPWSR